MKVTENEIRKAKQYPIESLFGTNWKRMGKIIRFRCPFSDHRDSTPSFTIYPLTNTFRCYGCDMKGDSIKFIQEYCGISFLEAVEYLNK